MNACEPEVVLMKEGFILTQCQDCKRLGMMYHQFMLSFDHLNFTAFCRYLEAMSFQSNSCPFYDEVDRVIIETYHMDIQFTLTEEEFYRFKGCLQEAQLQLQIDALFKS